LLLNEWRRTEQLCAPHNVNPSMMQEPYHEGSRGASRVPSRPRSAAAFIAQNKAWLVGGAAALFAASALVNRVSARKAEAETPPPGTFIMVEGVRLHYVDRGEGPAVVLLHGNGMMLQDFEVSGVLALAAQHHRVIAFDRPGFGYSERPRTRVWTPQAQAELVCKALKRIGVERAVVVGHSWGTLVALAMALDHPEAVAGLVLLSGYYFGTARPDVIPLSVPAIPLVGDLMAQTLAPLTALISSPAALKASFAPAPVSEKFASFPAAMALRPSQVRAAAADTAMMIPCAGTLSAEYGNLQMPVIIMAGEGDLIVHPSKHAEPLAKVVPGAELRMVPNRGHFFHYDVPERVVAAVVDVTDRAG
jgi:pimeloyl-ACP methyl ester carboxylesterase